MRRLQRRLLEINLGWEAFGEGFEERIWGFDEDGSHGRHWRWTLESSLTFGSVSIFSISLARGFLIINDTSKLVYFAKLQMQQILSTIYLLIYKCSKFTPLTSSLLLEIFLFHEIFSRKDLTHSWKMRENGKEEFLENPSPIIYLI